MKQFENALMAVAVHFNETITPERLESYRFALGDYPEDDLIQACKTLIRGKYFPRAYDFVRLLTPEPEDFRALATLRWGELLAHVWHDAPLPTDSLFTKALDACGDVYLIKHASEDDMRYLPARFINAYIGAAEVEKNERLALPDGTVGKLIGGLSKDLDMGRGDSS